MMEEEWIATHQHYKGGVYKFLFSALREADLVPMAVYEPEDGPIFTRPLAEFIAKFTALPGQADFAAIAAAVQLPPEEASE